ncbi:hypothetical protein NDU88_000927 [Pleurodeles waltl]|uniref:Uncharacterized protein n=1 Tax=Pleurodeles waltl TaxID=8319 RepID=A0AAV7VYQ2_PLEWA|nr:hypothetical protein NDU88_000927 [Pleurodeles waltl]
MMSYGHRVHVVFATSRPKVASKSIPSGCCNITFVGPALGEPWVREAQLPASLRQAGSRERWEAGRWAVQRRGGARGRGGRLAAGDGSVLRPALERRAAAPRRALPWGGRCGKVHASRTKGANVRIEDTVAGKGSFGEGDQAGGCLGAAAVLGAPVAV